MPLLRSTLILSTALASWSGAANAAESDEAAYDRDYLPIEIVVTGKKDAYVADDGTSATKTPTALIDVPQTVSVLTKDLIEDQAVTQLGDALRYVPGVSLESGEGHRDEIFIRGQESTADFYLDGLRDDAQYYRSLYNVERVEVLKGANALIFGRGGGGGVVNRVSKTARPGQQAIGLDAQVDSFGAFALTSDINLPMGDTVAARLNTTYEEFGNDRQYYEGRFIGISPTLTFDLGEATRLTAHYTYDDDSRVTDRGLPSLNGAPLKGYDKTFFGTPGFNRADAKAHLLRARIDHELTDNLSFNTSAQFADYDKAYANTVPTGTDGTSVTFSAYRDFTQRQNFIGQANLVWDVQTGAIEHTVLAGFEAIDQDTYNGRNTVALSSNTAPLADWIDAPSATITGLARERQSDLSVLSGYVQNQMALGAHVELTAGLRWERFVLTSRDLIGTNNAKRTDTMWSPRLGLVVKPDDRLSFYASYAQSHLPKAGDQFVVLSQSDAAFEPESFTNYEVGAKWLVKPDLFLTAALFRLDRGNTTAPNPDNSGTKLQVGKSKVEGLELSLVGKITPNWSTSLGYSLMDGEVTTSSDFAAAGTRLQQLPKHQIAAWNRVAVSDAISVGLGAIHQSEQFASFSGAVVLPSYWRFDAAAYWEIDERVNLQLNLENLFDAHYYPSAHGDNNIQPGKPFSARLGLRIDL